MPGRTRFPTPRTVYPEQFGATAAGEPHSGADDSLAFQRALDAISEGGTLECREGAVYPLRYPIVVHGRGVNVNLNGARLLTDLARKDRAPATLVNIGDSREWNREGIARRRAAGDLFNHFENPGFIDIGQRIEPGEARTNIERGYFPPAADAPDKGFTAWDCHVFGGEIFYYDDVAFSGNYGVQFSNAANCSAQQLRLRNSAQGFGFGSDVAPRTPYAAGCAAHDILVMQVNQAHTYYGAGFHGYARDCHDWNVTVARGCVAGSKDGNLWATNYALDCSSRNTGGECGRGSNGEGFLVGANSRRCTVEEGWVRNARRGFVNFGPLDIAPADANRFANSRATDVDYLISLQSRRARFDNIHGEQVLRAELLADNVNATGNRLCGVDLSRIETGGWSEAEVRRLNDLKC